MNKDTAIHFLEKLDLLMSCTSEDFIISSGTLDYKNGYYEILFITKLAVVVKNSLFYYLN